jgi:hypothetical protein
VKQRLALRVLKWGLAPLAIAALTGALGQMRAQAQRGKFFDATASLSAAERKALESMPALAMANATWAFGSADSVMKILKFELDQLPESEGASRARAFVRLAIIDDNPDGQAAVFSQACSDDPGLCEQTPLKEAAERETQSRFVAPGNQLPPTFLGGHPH